MDRAKLDELIARLAGGATRRVAVKGLVGGALASVGALAETVAKGKKKRKGRGKAGKKRGKEKGRATNDNAGAQSAGEDSAVGAEAKKAKSPKSKRCKKNGRNCRARGSADQQLSAV
jgi:hypothetical protein